MPWALRMTNRFEHLSLNRIEAHPRRPRRGGGGGNTNRTDRRTHGSQIIAQIDEIKKSVKNNSSTFSLDPKLIFKIRLSDKRDLLEDELGRSGLTILGKEPKAKKAIVVFSSDLELNDFTSRLEQYSGIRQGAEYAYLDAIESICPLEPEDRIGRLLELEPLREDLIAPLDLELWHTGDLSEMNKYLSDIRDVLKDISTQKNTFEMTDKYVGSYLCIARIKINREVLDLLLNEDIVKQINRRPKPAFENRYEYNPSLSSLADPLPPDPNNCGIAVIDSGVQTGHQLLGSTIADAQVFLSNSQKSTGGELDSSGHGTAVSGIAAYGDIEKCIRENKFVSSANIFSAKILDEHDEYDEDLLLETQLENAVDYFTHNYPNCHVFNLSIGNKDLIYRQGDMQFELAAKIDEIAYRYRDFNIVFVVAAGNSYPYNKDEGDRYITDYPKYILDSNSRIIDPATSAIALTVGSLSLGRGSLNYPNDAKVNSVAKIKGYPSPFTRSGFGVDGMIKPDLVYYGGDLVFDGSRPIAPASASVSIVTFGLVGNGKTSLFTISSGTSFSAPYVSNLAAQLFNKYPQASSNLVRSLIADSATLPVEIPKMFQTPSKSDSGKAKQIIQQLSVYGYGQPNVESAMYSTENQVVLLEDNILIEVGNFHIYEIPELPDDFLQTKGKRILSITLAFDPPTRHTRGDSYLGIVMEFEIWKGVQDKDILNIFADIKKAKNNGLEYNFEEISKDAFKKKHGSSCDVKLTPGSNIRKKGTLQRGQIEISDRVKNFNQPLYLVISCNRKWAKEGEIDWQRYALVVSIRHTNEEVKIYNQIQTKIQSRARQQLRIRG